MGLFSSSTKTYVSSTTLNLIDNPPNRLKDEATFAILSGKPIVEHVMSSFINGIAIQADRAYNYAYNHYTLGLPQLSIAGMTQVSESIVKEAIESENIGIDVAIIYSVIDKLNPVAAASVYLRSVRGMQINTSVITTHPFTITKNNSVLVLYDVEYLTETNELKIIYRTKYINRTPLTTYNEFTETISMPSGLYLGDDYCIAAYYIYDTINNKYGPEEYYWFYRLSDNTHPNITPNEEVFGTRGYLPVIPLRRDNVDLTSTSLNNTDLYKTSKKLLKKMGLDFEYIGSKLNENPDVAEIDHAYIMFGIDILSEKPDSIRYLAMYFDYLRDNSIYTKHNVTSVTDLLNTSLFNKLGFFNNTISSGELPQLVLEEYGFNITLYYPYIESTIYSGSIGNVGYATREIKSIQVPFTQTTNNQSFHKKTIDVIIFRVQINKRQYKNITVYDLIHFNTIYNTLGVTTSLKSILDDPENENFIIPVHYGVASQLPLKSRNMLYYDSCRLVLNSYKKVKVKWYQSGFFKALMFIGTFVLSVFAGQSWLIGLGSAISSGAVAVMSYVLPAAMIGLAVNYAAKFLVKELGVEFGMIVGVITTVAALSFNSGSTFNLLGRTLPTAETFLQIGSALMDASKNWYSSEIQNVYKQSLAFQEEAEKKWDALEEAQKLLDLPTGLTSLDLMATTQIDSFHTPITWESPEAFYNRTVHTGNIGVLSLDVVGNYVDIMLKLPEVNIS